MPDEVRPYTFREGRSEVGRQAMHILCPFCGVTIMAYRWSLAGGGKLCTCGVKFDYYGSATKREAV